MNKINECQSSCTLFSQLYQNMLDSTFKSLAFCGQIRKNSTEQLSVVSGCFSSFESTSFWHTGPQAKKLRHFYDRASMVQLRLCATAISVTISTTISSAIASFGWTMFGKRVGDSRVECLLQICKWNMEWQALYKLKWTHRILTLVIILVWHK